MGYYLDFVCEGNEELNQASVIEMFLKAGAAVAGDSAGGDRCVELVYSRVPSPIVVYKEESQVVKGKWAHVRLSWAVGAGKVHTALLSILELAQTIGWKVYDGQENSFLTSDKIGEMVASYSKTAANVVGLIGESDCESGD